MKKLMMMAVVCALAGVAQAYNVNWSCTNVKIPLAKDPTVSQTGIKVTSDSESFDANALTIHVFWQDKKDSSILHEIGDGWKNNSVGSLTSKPIMATGDDYYQAITADGQWSSSEKPTFVIKAEYETADGIYKFAGPATLAKAIGSLGSGNIVLSSSMTNGTWDYTANPVDTPEPTSGLLLLLGMAGLALRRRRA